MKRILKKYSKHHFKGGANIPDYVIKPNEKNIEQPNEKLINNHIKFLKLLYNKESLYTDNVLIEYNELVSKINNLLTELKINFPFLINLQKYYGDNREYEKIKESTYAIALSIFYAIYYYLNKLPKSSSYQCRCFNNIITLTKSLAVILIKYLNVDIVEEMEGADKSFKLQMLDVLMNQQTLKFMVDDNTDIDMNDIKEKCNESCERTNIKQIYDLNYEDKIDESQLTNEEKSELQLMREKILNKSKITSLMSRSPTFNELSLRH
jgi:hypothetical protein